MNFISDGVSPRVGGQPFVLLATVDKNNAANSLSNSLDHQHGGIVLLPLLVPLLWSNVIGVGGIERRCGSTGDIVKLSP